MSLYNLTTEYLELQSLLNDPDVDPDVLKDTMEGITGEIEDKLLNYGKIIRNEESDIVSIGAELSRLREIKSQKQKVIDKLKERVKSSMEAIGRKKIDTGLFTFSIQKNGGKKPIVLDVKDTSELPDDLVRIKEEADLDAIRALLEKGEGSQYAHFGEAGESLRIR